MLRFRKFLAIIVSLALFAGIAGAGYLPVGIDASAAADWVLDYTSNYDGGTRWYGYGAVTDSIDAQEAYGLGGIASINIAASGGWGLGLKITPAGGTLDFTAHSGRYLQFAIKGAVGGEQFNIGFRRGDYQAYKTPTATDAWTVIAYPIDDLITLAASHGANSFTAADGIIITSANGTAVQVWVADIRIVDDPEVEVPQLYTDATASWSLSYAGDSGQANAGSGTPSSTIEKNTDGFLPLDENQTYNGKPSIKIQSTGSGGWWFGTTQFANFNLTQYAEGYSFQFALYSTTGAESFNIGFRSAILLEGGGSADALTNGFTATAAGWKVYSIPVATLLTNKTVGGDFSSTNQFYIGCYPSAATTSIWLSDIKIVKTSIYTDPNTDNPWALTYNASSSGSAGSDGDVLEKSPFVNGLPVDRNNLYNEWPSIKVNTTGSATWWFGFITVPGFNLTQYKSGYNLQFKVKGANGNEQFTAGFKSAGANITVDCVAGATGVWETINIPVSDILAKDTGNVLVSADGFVMVNKNGNPLTVWISDVKIVRDNQYFVTEIKEVLLKSSTLESAEIAALDVFKTGDGVDILDLLFVKSKLVD